jgi:hypothetical protein
MLAPSVGLPHRLPLLSKGELISHSFTGQPEAERETFVG